MIPLRKRTALSYLIEPITQTLWMAGRENWTLAIGRKLAA